MSVANEEDPAPTTPLDSCPAVTTPKLEAWRQEIAAWAILDTCPAATRLDYHEARLQGRAAWAIARVFKGGPGPEAITPQEAQLRARSACSIAASFEGLRNLSHHEAEYYIQAAAAAAAAATAGQEDAVVRQEEEDCIRILHRRSLQREREEGTPWVSTVG